MYSDVFSKRIEKFMMYIECHDIPKRMGKRFSDIDENFNNEFLDVDVYSWLFRELDYNMKNVKLYSDGLKDKYPCAYEKISSVILKREKKSNDSQRIICLMNYLNQSEAVIPNGRSLLRFCDIDSNCLDESLVGVWIQRKLQTNEGKFIKLFSKYKIEYPLAYSKLSFKLQKRDKSSILEKRIMVILSSLDYPLLDYNIRFCDIGGDSYDKVVVVQWIKRELTVDFEQFYSVLREYCDKNHLDVKVILRRFENFQNTITLNRKENTEEAREEFFMRYLNEHDFPEQVDKSYFAFGKVDMYQWFYRNYICYGDKFFEKLEIWKDVYPQAYLKLLKREKSILSKSNSQSFSFEVKLETILKYLEVNKVPMIRDNISFYDMDKMVPCYINAIVWLYNVMKSDTGRNRLIENLRKYESIYPVGSSMVYQKINNSKSSLFKERALFIEELKLIRDSYFDKGNGDVIDEGKKRVSKTIV